MKNEFTKTTIYSTIKELVNGKNPEISEALKSAIIERMDKDIEQATKKSSGNSKPTANDLLNEKIRDVITSVLENGDMTYSDFIKTVQAEFTEEISAQKITANVTKLKADGVIVKYEDGKGKSKKLYIKLAE